MKSFYPFFSIVECKRDNLMTQGACNAIVLFWFLPNVLIRSKKVLTKWAHLYFCRLLHFESKVTNHLKLMILIAMIYLLSVSKVINPNLVSQSLKIDTSNALEVGTMKYLIMYENHEIHFPKHEILSSKHIHTIRQSCMCMPTIYPVNLSLRRNRSLM